MCTQEHAAQIQIWNNAGMRRRYKYFWVAFAILAVVLITSLSVLSIRQRTIYHGDTRLRLISVGRREPRGTGVIRYATVMADNSGNLATLSISYLGLIATYKVSYIGNITTREVTRFSSTIYTFSDNSYVSLHSTIAFSPVPKETLLTALQQKEIYLFYNILSIYLNHTSLRPYIILTLIGFGLIFIGLQHMFFPEKLWRINLPLLNTSNEILYKGAKKC
ncbi:MAG: hypothetical protein FWE42_00140 [Defluviitaleaceae bacterium]|nr:hypothetical protein [Defluviitaleaceae bacterium]